MRGMFSFSIFAAICISTTTHAAALNSKALGEDMAAVTRAMDIFMAREEMKGTLSTAMVGSALRSLAGDPSPEATKKTLLISDSGSLSDCEIKFEEKKSPDGSEAVTFIQYAGANCPIKMVVDAKILTNGSGATGDIVLEIAILSPALKAQLEIESMKMPIHVDINVGPSADGGFEALMKMKMGGEMVTAKWGLVNYNADMNSLMTFSMAGMKARTEVDEDYNGGGVSNKFKQLMEADNSSQKETYWVDGAVVTKDDFTKKHQAIAVPGMSQDKIPLAQPHACSLTTYDSARYTLDQVRTAIKDSSIAALPKVESVPMIPFKETGNLEMVAMLFGQPTTEMELSVTQDVARFKFHTQNKATELGAITVLLGDHVDVTKVISNRVVRIVCDPK